VEQVDHVACTDLRQRQIAELGQYVVLEPARLQLSGLSGGRAAPC
jgi:hypothetical protein